MLEECEEHDEHSLESTSHCEQPPIRLAIAATYRGVRDDVCAWCFRLALPTKKALVWNVQLYNDNITDTYLTFCSRACRKRWCEEFDEECEAAILEASRYVRTAFSWPTDPFEMVIDFERKDSPPSTKEVNEVC